MNPTGTASPECFHGLGIIAMQRFFRAWRLMQRFCIWMASGECQGMKRYSVFSSARGCRITVDRWNSAPFKSAAFTVE